VDASGVGPGRLAAERDRQEPLPPPHRVFPRLRGGETGAANCRGLAAPAGRESPRDPQPRAAEVRCRRPQAAASEAAASGAAALGAAVSVAAMPDVAPRQAGVVEPRLTRDRLSDAGSPAGAGSTRLGDRWAGSAAEVQAGRSAGGRHRESAAWPEVAARRAVGRMEGAAGGRPACSAPAAEPGRKAELVSARVSSRRVHGLRPGPAGDGRQCCGRRHRCRRSHRACGPVLRGESPLEAAAPGDPGHQHPPQRPLRHWTGPAAALGGEVRNRSGHDLVKTIRQQD